MIDEIKLSQMDWLLNVPGDALLYVVKDGQDYKTTKDALLSSLGVGLFIPEGLSVTINRTIEWVQDNFDLDSESPNYLLGVSSMAGWRIKLQNGGRVSVGWHPTDYPDLGATGGSPDAVVVEHGHKWLHSWEGDDDNTGGSYDEFTFVPGNIPVGDPKNPIEKTGVSGVGKNMQPYIVELHIERAFDAFVGGSSQVGQRPVKVVHLTGDYTFVAEDATKFMVLISPDDNSTYTAIIPDGLFPIGSGVMLEVLFYAVASYNNSKLIYAFGGEGISIGDHESSTYSVATLKLLSTETAFEPNSWSIAYKTGFAPQYYKVSPEDDYADDTAAAAGGISVGRYYHTSGVIKMRLS